MFQTYGRRPKPRDVVFVIGMGRSGSSALARVLALCGGALPLEILSANTANPTGYWEPAKALRLNDAFLGAHGSTWYDGSLALQTGVVGALERRDFVDAIAEFLKAGFEDNGPIILKEPRISALLPYWTAAASALRLRVKLIHIFREPSEVARSLDVRDELPPAHSFALWLKYNLMAERDARGMERVFVSYDALMSDWERVVAKCAGELELDLTIAGEQRRAVAGFLTPALRHHDSASVDAPRVRISLDAWVPRTYALLKAAEAGSVPAAEFDAVRSDYVRSSEATQFRLVRRPY